MNKTVRNEALIDHIFKRAKCPVCGKEFIPTYEYAYKLTNKKTQHRHFFCGYNCFRKAQKNTKVWRSVHK